MVSEIQLVSVLRLILAWVNVFMSSPLEPNFKSNYRIGLAGTVVFVGIFGRLIWEKYQFEKRLKEKEKPLLEVILKEED